MYFFKSFFYTKWTIFKSLLNFYQTRQKYARHRALMNVQVMSFQKVQGHLRGETIYDFTSEWEQSAVYSDSVLENSANLAYRK